MKYGQLHCRDLERLKAKALKFNKGNLNKKVSVDITWWKNNILGSFNTKRTGNPSFAITTDASTIGRGAVFNNTSAGG